MIQSLLGYGAFKRRLFMEWRYAIPVVSLTKSMFRDIDFMKKVILIALPVALQGALNMIINMVDTMMIGTLGSSTIAAVGLANKLFFVFTLLVFGISSGSGILAAQYWGNQDKTNVRKVLGLALVLSIIASLLFVIPAQIAPEAVMRIFTTSEEAIEIGAKYLKVAAIAYPFIGITNTYVAMLRAIKKVKAPVVVSIITIIINVTLNYTLIFGNFGAPELGAVGAAIATLTARFVECVSIITMVYVTKLPIACKIKELFGQSKQFAIQFYNTSSPVIANEFLWGLGTAIYSIAYGRMGDDAVAAMTIATTIQDTAIVIFQGLSAATAVILGNEMGAGKLKRAESYAKYFFILQMIFTVIAGLICYGIRWKVIGFYNIPEHVALDVSHCVIAFILFSPFRMFNFINVVGVLRSGGDTKACFFIDTSGVWFIGIPMAFIGGLWLDLPIYIVYSMVMLEEVYKTILGYFRYRQKKWLRNLNELLQD